VIARAHLKFLRSLSRKKVRRAEGRLVLEGARVVHEALRAGAVEELYLAESVEVPSGATGVPMDRLSQTDAEALSETRASAGIYALAVDPVRKWDANVWDENSLILLADGLADPGNLGTLIRTAAAMGFAAVAVSAGSVDPTNPKVVRASAGALFQIPVMTAGMSHVRAAGFSVWAADGRGDAIADVQERPGRVALALGNEPRGHDAPIRTESDRVVAVSLAAGVESLNVAVAAGILMDRLRALPIISR
jgi:TrmH family RNA methyltransferase